eukprot:scaffold1307_cov200-Pinguiococcus_pyrenoidosus.AAC.106
MDDSVGDDSDVAGDAADVVLEAEVCASLCSSRSPHPAPASLARERLNTSLNMSMGWPCLAAVGGWAAPGTRKFGYEVCKPMRRLCSSLRSYTRFLSGSLSVSYAFWIWRNLMVAATRFFGFLSGWVSCAARM